MENVQIIDNTNYIMNDDKQEELIIKLNIRRK